jgi:class 3 adenylate cyclase/TolB-like protein
LDRKLAAILAADVVGYSAQMERDEAGTFARMKAGHRDLFAPEIARHHGRIFKLMGDGLLAEFASAVAAVECAVALQRGLAERNANVPEAERLSVRIGINLGDVIVAGDDLYGEGVNLAARLEQLAEPGGICVSAKVAREVARKLAFGFEAMGGQKVKNFAEPVEVFRVLIDGSARRPRLAARRIPRRTVAGLAAVVVAAIAVLAVWLVGPGRRADEGPPSVAVLPFANLSGDPAQDYLGLGIADDIITMLSTAPGLRVVSRQSSFAYAKPEKVQAVARKLGAGYIVEGSVKKSAATVRIAVQLIDGRTGENLWASRYEEESGDVAALQEAVAARIYATLAGTGGELRKLGGDAAWSKSAPSLDEYDYHVRGVAAFFGSAPGGNDEARRIWRAGLAKFPDSALLRLGIAATRYREVIEERSPDPWTAVEEAWTLVKEADALPDKSRIETWLTRHLLALLLPPVEGNFEAAVREAEAAHALVPYDTFFNADLALVMTNGGKTDRGVAWAEYAVRTEAIVPDWYRERLAWAYYHAGRPAEALAEYDRMARPPRVAKAAALARLGRLDEARALAAEHLADVPGFNLAKEARRPAFRHPQMVAPLLAPYLADLAAAGFPEK